MGPNDEQELQRELYWDEDRERYRNRHKLFFIPRAPAGRRVILVLMTLIWGVLGLGTASLWGDARDLSAVALLVVLGVEGIVSAMIAGWVWEAIGSTARSIIRPLAQYWYLTLFGLCFVSGRIAGPFLEAEETAARRAHGATAAEIAAGVSGATSGPGWRILTTPSHGYLKAGHAEAGQACEQQGGRLPSPEEAGALVRSLRVPKDMKFWLAETPDPEATASFIVSRRVREDTSSMSLYRGKVKEASVLCVLAAPGALASPTTAPPPTAPERPAPAPTPAPLPPPRPDELAKLLGEGGPAAATGAIARVRGAEPTSPAAFAAAALARARCDELGVSSQLRCAANYPALQEALAEAAAGQKAELRALVDQNAFGTVEWLGGIAWGLSLTDAPLPPDHPAFERLVQHGRPTAQVAELAIFNFAHRDPSAAREHAARLGTPANDTTLRTLRGLAAGASLVDACRALGRLAIGSGFDFPLATGALRDLPDACAKEALHGADEALAKFEGEGLMLMGGRVTPVGAVAAATLRRMPPHYKVSDLWSDLLVHEQRRRTGIHRLGLMRPKDEPELFVVRPCEAADFGLEKGAAMPRVSAQCFTFARPELLPKALPLYRPL